MSKQTQKGQCLLESVKRTQIPLKNKINKWDLAVALPRGVYTSTVSRSNWNLACWFLWREENQRTRRKTLGGRTRTNNKLDPHVTPGPGKNASNEK